MSEEDDMRLAEAYCRNMLDESTRAEVDARAQKDPAFHQLLNDTRVLLAGIDVAGRNELKQAIDQWEQAHQPESATKVISWRTWVAVGIAASVMLALSLFFWESEPVPQTMALYNAYYQAYPNVVMPTVRGIQGDSSRLNLAYQTYDLGEYEKAAKLFSGLPEKDAAVYFYTGQCYLVLGQTDLAITNFIQCMKSEESFVAQAQWYLSLAYLKQGEVIAAKEALERVMHQQNSYSVKAESILKQL